MCGFRVSEYGLQKSGMKLYSVVKEPLCLLSLAGDALEFLLLMHLCYFVYMHETGVWWAVKWRHCVHDNCFIFDHLLWDSFLVLITVAWLMLSKL